MGEEYRATDRLRSVLDANGVFWIDVPQLDRRRTCWKMNEGGPYWYADQMSGREELTVFCQTFFVDRALEDLGMAVDE